MKGGYQIIDLSGVTVGTQATIAGIYDATGGNNGKPLMIITPDGQRVFAEVKVGTNKYVTAYLGADGSNYTVEISKANKVDITKQESSAELDGRVDDIEEDLAKVKPQYSETATGDKRVVLTDFDTTTPFTTPSDGIVRIITKAAESSGTSDIRIKGLSGTTPGDFIAMQVTSNGSAEFFGLYIKKGCKIFGTNTGNTSTIDFNPFVS